MEPKNKDSANPAPESPTLPPEPEKEIGGRKGPEPTRYGDWENGGKCVDF